MRFYCYVEYKSQIICKNAQNFFVLFFLNASHYLKYMYAKFLLFYSIYSNFIAIYIVFLVTLYFNDL